jgi:hypothetical protein
MDANIVRGTPYFDDGNIILAAASQDGRRHMFRAFRSLLSYHSPVLGELLNGPNAGSFDGASVYSVPDDATDLSALLMVLHDPS